MCYLKLYRYNRIKNSLTSSCCILIQHTAKFTDGIFSTREMNSNEFDNIWSKRRKWKTHNYSYINVPRYSVLQIMATDNNLYISIGYEFSVES